MNKAITQSVVEKTHLFMHTNGITLHVVAAGPEDGPLVILLHGFPEFWYGWRAQIPALAMAGYRVLAPDLRGYNLSDKPAGLAAYRPEVLVEDIAGLIAAAGREQANIIGHDWGGAVAWWLVLARPERVHKAVMINIPHPTVFARQLRTDQEQQRKSWYMAFFQLPGLPEALLGSNNAQAMSAALKGSSRPGTFREADLEQYRRAWSRPGATMAMLNYYRAVARFSQPRFHDERVHIPLQIIWGRHDPFLKHEMAAKSVDMCDDGRLQLIAEATHWVQHEFPGRVNNTILSFLTPN